MNINIREEEHNLFARIVPEGGRPFILKIQRVSIIRGET
jgi:hypothetical protein